MEGSYKHAETLSSSRARLIMALSEATLVAVDTFSTQDLASLDEHMRTVIKMGQYRQFLLVRLVKVVRVVARRQDKQVSALLARLVITAIRKCGDRQGESMGEVH